MSSHRSTCRAATPKQLTFLRSLALQTATTFSLPQTWRQASREIDRLKKLKLTHGTHVEVPWDMDPAEQPYATGQNR